MDNIKVVRQMAAYFSQRDVTDVMRYSIKYLGSKLRNSGSYTV